jgi:predicted O-methyltransferase YrrM
MDAARRELAAEIRAAARAHDAADQVQELLALMAAEPAVTSTQVPIGAGLQLAVKR